MPPEVSSPRITVTGLSERDIDFLLLEEVYANSRFREWLLQLFLPNGSPAGRLTQAKKSFFSSSGESDLEFWFELPDGRNFVGLVENKISASFQRDQSSRYCQRGSEYVGSGKAHLYRTMLFAPSQFGARYIGGEEFDVVLSYEKVAQWLKGEPDMSERIRYKIYLLESACEKASLGYQVIQDQDVSNFWVSYWRLVTAHVPELEMREPSPKPAKSSFVYFHPAGLRKGVVLVHKLAHGNLDLQFSGLGNRLSRLRRALSAKLEKDMSIKAAGRSGVVRILVPPLRPGKPFEPQRRSALEGILAASRLLEWYERQGQRANIQ